MAKLVLKNRLSQICYEQQITFDCLADLCGVSYDTLCAIDREGFVPTVRSALLISIALGVSVDTLFYFSKE